MDHILLCTNHIPPITTIYNSFIEDYMPAANGSYVKVYLYIAKCLQAKESNFSISYCGSIRKYRKRYFAGVNVLGEKGAYVLKS